MNQPQVLELKQRVNLHPDSTISRGTQAIVEVTTGDGRVLRHQPAAVRGTPEDPMTTEEVEWKAMDLMAPILGDKVAQEVIGTVRDLESLSDVRRLTNLVQKGKDA